MWRHRPSPDRTGPRGDGDLGPFKVAAIEGFDAALQLFELARRRVGPEALEREIDEGGEVALRLLGELVAHPASRTRPRSFANAAAPSTRSPLSASSMAAPRPFS